MKPVRLQYFSSPTRTDQAPLDDKPLLTFPDPHVHALSVRAKALVFEDPVSRTLLARIERLAPSTASILLRGVTGTGKELVARYVHNLSPRRARPFIAVNCGAISEHLIESELFGHERGAFTGAVAAKAGWFEVANGSTLFLDEIGDLPLVQQVKLLRVLQEREVVRLGSRRPIPVDVRLIAATNVDLEESVAAGRFREDLYYRLKVAMLYLPPLRDRPGDIPPLLEHFISYYAQRLGLERMHLAPASLEMLKSYPWPGNIRELENAVHHAVVVCQDHILQPEDFALLPLPAAVEKRDVAVLRPLNVTGGDLAKALIDIYHGNKPEGVSVDVHIEEIIMRTAFEFCNGNQSATARLLGVTRNVVRTRLQRFGLVAD